MTLFSVMQQCDNHTVTHTHTEFKSNRSIDVVFLSECLRQSPCCTLSLHRCFPTEITITHTHTHSILTPCHWVGKCFMNGLSVMYIEHLALLQCLLRCVCTCVRMCPYVHNNGCVVLTNFDCIKAQWFKKHMIVMLIVCRLLCLCAFPRINPGTS